MTELITLHNVVKSYGDRLVLDGVDFSVKLGQRYVLTGPSGSGKTTLLQILGLLTKPTSGQLAYKGLDCTHWGEVHRAIWRNQTVGFVFQHHYLIPELSILDNVLLAGWIGHKVNKSRAEKLLTSVGLGDRLMDYPRQLSGGEAQRVAIVRALMNEPKLVLADEPTGNLDEETSWETLEVLLQMLAELQAALVLVTHDSSVVNWVGGEIFRLERGKLQRFV